MTFREQLIITVVDKLAIGGLLLFAVWWLNRLLETFKSRRNLENDFAKLRDAKRLEFLDKQLSQFYYPIYIRLHIDGVVWNRILDKREGNDDLQKRVGEAIERNIILPNHEEIVRIIQSNIHFAQCDGAAFRMMLQYIRHVAVYKAMREAGCHDRDPVSLGEPWPKDFLTIVEKTTGALQQQFDVLVAEKTGK